VFPNFSSNLPTEAHFCKSLWLPEGTLFESLLKRKKNPLHKEFFPFSAFNSNIKCSMLKAPAKLSQHVKPTLLVQYKFENGQMVK